MKLRSCAAGNAMWWPGRGEIRLIRKMVTRVDVAVFSRHHMLVAGLAGQIVVDGEAQLGAPSHRQRTARAEVVLHVDDDQRPHTAHPNAATVASWGDKPGVCLPIGRV